MNATGNNNRWTGDWIPLMVTASSAEAGIKMMIYLIYILCIKFVPTNFFIQSFISFKHQPFHLQIFIQPCLADQDIVMGESDTKG